MEWLKLTQVDLGRLGNLERKAIEWLYRRFLDRLSRRFGGIQRCPWCKQCAQAHDGWHFDSKTDPAIDALHCGNCGGASRWRFEMGMMPLDPHRLSPPPACKGAADAPCSMMEDDMELRECPFCGGDETSHGYVAAGGIEWGTAGCEACDAQITAGTEAEAIAAWNRRAGEPQ